MNESSRPSDVAASTENEIPLRELERWEFAPPLGQDGRRIVKFQFCTILEIACTYPKFIELVTDRLDRWKQGRYTVTEAVQVISDAYPGEIDVRSFRIQLNRAIWQGKLAVRENGIRIDADDVVAIGRAASSNPIIESRDLNEWLENEGSVHRIFYPYEKDGSRDQARITQWDESERAGRIGSIEISKASQPITPLESLPLDLRPSHTFAPVNWERWRRLDRVRLWEAACLVAGFEPPKDGDKEIWASYQLNGFPDSFFEVWEVVNRDQGFSRNEFHPASGLMLHTVHVGYFALWANLRGFQIAPEMNEIASRYSKTHPGVVARFNEVYGVSDSLARAAQTSAPAATPQVDHVPPSAPDFGEQNQVSPLQSQQAIRGPEDELPGKLPRIAIGRLAVKAAWEMEREKNQRASAKDVMSRLQQWADNGSESDVLKKSDMENRSVIWLTTKYEEKSYTLEACQKTLETWNKSRQ